MENIAELESIVIVLLVVISLIAIVVKYLRIPYTVALVIGGLFLGFIEPTEIELTSELILALFLPPLVFEAAFHLNFKEVKDNLPRTLTFAIPGVIITMLIVGYIISWTTSLDLTTALVFGALIAATDPVAVIVLFRELGVSKKLATLVEGESLLNDGTAIVVFHVMLGIALTGHFDLAEGLIDFVKVVTGGLAVGFVLGWVVAQIIARVDDHLIEITLTTALAFGSFLVAEEFHFSGVLAVVVAGLINGNLGTQGMSPTTRIILNNFWEYVAFIANSLIFLLIGLQIHIPILLDVWQPIAWAIIAVLAGRAVSIYGLGQIVNQFSDRLPLSWHHVFVWGGLKGAISLALALSLPLGLGQENRELLLLMSFGVVLFTLFIQGTTIGSLVKRLGIIEYSEEQEKYEFEHAQLISLQDADDHLDELLRKGLVTKVNWQHLKNIVQQQIHQQTTAVQELLDQYPSLAEADLRTAQNELLRVQRSSLLSLKREGIINDETFEKLATQIDVKLQDK